MEDNRTIVRGMSMMEPGCFIKIPQLLAQNAHVIPNSLVNIVSNSVTNTITIYGTPNSIFYKIPYDILIDCVYLNQNNIGAEFWILDHENLLFGIGDNRNFLQGKSEELIALMEDPMPVPTFYGIPEKITLNNEERYLYGYAPVLSSEQVVVGLVALVGDQYNGVFPTTTVQESVITCANTISIKITAAIDDLEPAPIPPYLDEENEDE